jgi:acyl-CoA thioesterase FadM
MTSQAATVPYRVRVRYAECDAWGELQLFQWHALFDAAVADGLLQRGVDWRQATQPGQALRPLGMQLHVLAPAGYDDDLCFELTGARIEGDRVTLCAEARRRPAGPLLATAAQEFGHRGPPGEARPWLPGLREALLALPPAGA